MWIRNRVNQVIIYGFLLLLTLFLVGCGKNGLDDPNKGSYYYYPSETETQQISPEEVAKPYYLILENDQIEETLQVYDYKNKRQYQYRYGLTTSFKDKYGNRASVTAFTPGRAIWLGNIDADGRLIELGISDQVWEYSDITRFKTSPSEGILTIASSDYRYDSESVTFSDDQLVDFSSITEDDILSVVGVDKQILSVNVTTGHGTLELVNTELFEGSFLQIGTKIFAEITPEMIMDLQEGTYLLAVANDGWGGSRQITIEKGETTVVDLDELKGEGPKYGTIAFVISPPGASLFIDGTLMDYTDVISLKYGKHAISVVSEEYGEWVRTLYVNSEEATIVITLSEDAKEGADTGTTNSGTGSAEAPNTPEEPKPNTPGSSQSTEGSESSEKKDYSDIYEYLNDYLSTLSSIVS